MTGSEVRSRRDGEIEGERDGVGEFERGTGGVGGRSDDGGWDDGCFMVMLLSRDVSTGDCRPDDGGAGVVMRD